MEFTTERQRRQPESNAISRQYYGGVCIITDSPDNVTASHIYPIGQTRFRALARYPIAAAPMEFDIHHDFEWDPERPDKKRTPGSRRAWLDEHVHPDHRQMFFGVHLPMLHTLCDEKGINYK